MSIFQRCFTTFISGLVVCGLLVFNGCGEAEKPGPNVIEFSPERGQDGDEVTIKGENFENDPAMNRVKFGEVAVPSSGVTFASGTMIKVKVPSGAKTGLISVTTSTGTGYSTRPFNVLPGPAPGVEWTFLIYLDADNNLETAGIGDFQEMAKVGSSSRVNIVVQMDRNPGTEPPYYTGFYGGWDGTRRFLVKKDDDPSITPLQDLGEQNMGDPEVLRAFVEWGIKNYPAAHYALVIWNHGAGWRTQMEKRMLKIKDARTRGETAWGITKIIASDDTDNDELYMKEVQTALETALENLKAQGMVVKLDIVGFDACLMGMVEVAYALRNVANYMVGSEDLEPGDGWPYDKILNELTSRSSVAPGELAGVIVTEYVNSYRGGREITQSALDIAGLNNLVRAIDGFTDKAGKEWTALKNARGSAMQYHQCMFSCWSVDLGDFADEVYNRVTAADIKAAALDLKNAVSAFVIKEGHSVDREGSHGVSIYFPPDQTAFNGDPEHYGYEESNTYMPVDFVKFSRWDNWLNDFYLNIR